MTFNGIIIKNLLRIYQNFDKPISPALYDNLNSNRYLKVFNKDNIFTHYKIINNGVCGFSKSPCTSFDIDVKKKFFFSYSIYHKF